LVKRFKSKIMIKNNIEYVISEYFLLSPSDRPTQCKDVANNITTVDDIMLVLAWGNDREIQESYDSAVDLLAQCGEILLNFIDTEFVRGILRRNLFIYEEELSMLTKGIALSDDLSFQKKMEGITKLMSSSRRVIKAAIIDALSHIKDQTNADDLTIRSHLTEFSSDNEPDQYIRQYAKNELIELN
jgi:hypothetical protein